MCASCCDGVYDLVAAGKLDFGDAVDALRNAVPTMPRATARIAIATILSLVAEHAAFEASRPGPYRCPWGVSAPPHPCIGIVRDRPEIWPDLLSSIRAMLEAAFAAQEEPAARAVFVRVVPPAPPTPVHPGGRRGGHRYRHHPQRLPSLLSWATAPFVLSLGVPKG